MDNGFPSKDWPEIMNRTPTIQTFTGKTINYVEPDLDTIDILDIAQGLANENRYVGQTVFPYSVAQHSVLCSYEAPEHLRFEALMHDAHEAYTKDIPSTMKPLIVSYQVLEDRMEDAVREKFELPPGPMDPRVKVVDVRMLVTEAQKFGFDWWPCYNVAPYSDTPITEWGWRHARWMFLSRFHELTRDQWA